MNQEVFLATGLVLKAPRNYAETEISPENFLFQPERCYTQDEITHLIRRNTRNYLCERYFNAFLSSGKSRTIISRSHCHGEHPSLLLPAAVASN